MCVIVCVCVCVCVCEDLLPSPLQSMLLVAPKLNAANLNTQLLKYFAKCQLDEQVCLPGGKAHPLCDMMYPLPSARNSSQHHYLPGEDSVSSGPNSKESSCFDALPCLVLSKTTLHILHPHTSHSHPTIHTSTHPHPIHPHTHILYIHMPTSYTSTRPHPIHPHTHILYIHTPTAPCLHTHTPSPRA